MRILKHMHAGDANTYSQKSPLYPHKSPASAKEPCISAKEPYIYPKDPYISANTVTQVLCVWL